MKNYIYYLAATITTKDGNMVRHYFIDSNKSDLVKLEKRLSKDHKNLDSHIDTIWRDVGKQANRKQITAKPFSHFSDPKRLLYWGN